MRRVACESSRDLREELAGEACDAGVGCLIPCYQPDMGWLRTLVRAKPRPRLADEPESIVGARYVFITDGESIDDARDYEPLIEMAAPLLHHRGRGRGHSFVAGTRIPFERGARQLDRAEAGYE